MAATIETKKKRSNEVVTVQEWNNLFLELETLLKQKIRLDGDVLDSNTQLIFVNGGGIINVRTEQSADLLGYQE